jgi:3-oxoacyl-[acyl-carrier-protein] synthase II
MGRAMAAALEAGGVAPWEVDYINAHGTGTGENDAVETRAIKAVFGQAAQKIPVSSTKSQIGHTMGAAGALEAVASILAIVGQFVPPTIHFDRARPDCDLDYVPNASRRHAVSVVLSNSAGFGGANSALVLGRWQRHPPSREVTYLDNRVVITGMGVATCLGIGLEAFWDGAREGRCGLGPISSFDPSPYGCALAGEVPMAGLLRWVNPRNLRHLDPLSINAVACTRMALNDARLKISAENAQRIGVLFGTGAGPLDTVAAFNQDIVRAGPLQVKPFLFQNSVFNAAAGHVCQEFGIKGCTSTLIIGDASFNNCVAYAYEILKKGTMDGILAASADVFCEPLLAGFAKLGLASREACRPFDARRDGLSPSGAAAAFMLETLAHASGRGARIYGEIKGYGMSSDGYRCAGCDPSGVDWSRAMTLAIEESGFEPGQIDYVAATATGLRVMDLAEANAIKKALGPAACHVPVSAIRSLVGHSGAAGPALALAASLLGMRDGLIPPTAGLESPDPQCDLALVRGAPLRRKIHSALVNSFAWGGSYVTLAIAGYSP